MKVSAAKAVVSWPAVPGARATRWKVVLVKPNGSRTSMVVTKRRAVLKNLAAGSYKVSVTAGNASGWSRSSRVQRFTVRQD